MIRIAEIRKGLDQIPGSRLDEDPEESGRGLDSGVQVSTIWPGVDDDEQDPTIAPIARGTSEGEDTDDNENIPECEPVIEFGAEVDETLPALGSEQKERIRRSIQLHGMDALGWYSSFHYRQAQWGIYIPVISLSYMIDACFSNLPITLVKKARLAFHAILNHELFHFAADYMVSQWELIEKLPLWVPSRTIDKAMQKDRQIIEEMLANAYMLKSFRTAKAALRVRGKLDALREFTKEQPPGYCDGWKVGKADWDTHLRSLAEHLILFSSRIVENHPLYATSRGFDFARLFPIRPRIDWRYCPIHLIHDNQRLGIPEPWLDLSVKAESPASTT